MKHGQDHICHICAKKFACRSNLTYHLTTHQPKLRQVQCTKCQKWLVLILFKVRLNILFSFPFPTQTFLFNLNLSKLFFFFPLILV